MKPDPLFVFGVSRGGTNLLSSLINASPQVYLAQDVLLPVLNDWRSEALEQVRPDIDASRWPPDYPDYYFSKWGPEAFDVLKSSAPHFQLTRSGAEKLNYLVAQRASLEDRELANSLANLEFSTHVGAVFQILSRISSRNSERSTPLKWVGSKEVWAVDMVNFLAHSFPKAKFIEISRDPRGVINSLIQLADADATQAAHVPSYLRHWRKHLAISHYFKSQIYLNDRILSVRYEDILHQPEESTQIIADFLGIDGVPLAQAILGSSSLADNSSVGALGRRLAPSRGSAWSLELRSDLKPLIEFMVGPEMLVRGDLDHFNPDVFHDDEALLSTLRQLSQFPGKWRSDSGSPEAELRNESMRWGLLSRQHDPDEKAILRGFLTRDFFDRCSLALGITHTQICLPNDSGIVT